MKRPQLFIVWLTVILNVVIFCLLPVQSVQAKEPYYKGIPLSDWLLDDSGNAGGAPDAIRQIGTNAIPTLLDLLDATPKTIKWVAAKLDSKTMRAHLIDDNDDVVFSQIKESVVSAFVILGTNAEPAVPQMVRLLNKDNEDISLYAAAALAGVGPKGFAALTNALMTAQDPSVRLNIIDGLGANGGNSELVTQIFIDTLKDKSPNVRRSAAGSLGGRDPDLVIPALMPMLDDPDLTVRQWAAAALSNYGSKARSAAPKILSIYTNNPDERVFEALKTIDLKMAEQAEVVVVNSGPLNPKRQYYTKTALNNGLELIAGGYIQTELPSEPNRYLSNAELIDPKTGNWQKTGEMTTNRFSHVAILLRNGKVLVAGGADGKNILSSAELYDPATGKWSKTGSLHKPHAGGRIVLQSDGKVMFFSGNWDPNIRPSEMELYEPTAGLWTVVTNR
jgi:hypothetical protein